MGNPQLKRGGCMLKHIYTDDHPAIFDLTEYGILQVNGADAKKFLQGQLTCDLEHLSPMGTLAAHCNPQGRVVSLFYLYHWHESYYLIMSKNLIPAALAYLKKYAIFFKIALEDVTSVMQCLGYAGDIRQLFHGEDIAILHLPMRKPRGIIFADTNKIKQIKNELLQDSALKSYTEWHEFLIELSIPTLIPETSGKFLPHELNLLHLQAVSFDKGCYTGQEIVARMHYRGKLKTHFRHLTVTSVTAPCLGTNMDISHYDERGKTSGCIIDCCQSQTPAHTYQVLVMIKEKSE